jgi:hypothetical protein
MKITDWVKKGTSYYRFDDKGEEVCEIHLSYKDKKTFVCYYEDFLSKEYSYFECNDLNLCKLNADMILRKMGYRFDFMGGL